MEPSMGLLLNLHLRNGNCHRRGIHRHFARECIVPHLIQKNNVVQQANLVQNEMFQLF
jgi:hypothetical protein